MPPKGKRRKRAGGYKKYLGPDVDSDEEEPRNSEWRSAQVGYIFATKVLADNVPVGFKESRLSFVGAVWMSALTLFKELNLLHGCKCQ